MTTRLGLNAKIYRNTGTYGTPTWTVMDCVRDLTLGDTMGEGDATARANGGFKASVPTLREISIDFTCPNIKSDANIIAIRVAYAGRTSIDVACMDDAIATTAAHGVRFHGCFFKRERGENIADPQTVAYTLKPTEAGSTEIPQEMLTA